MPVSNPFLFLKVEWPQVYEAATRAAALAIPDPRTSCFYARRALELAVNWVYRADSSLRVPYQDNLSALIHEPTFRDATGETIFQKARLVTKLGNFAVHSSKPIATVDSVTAVRELFHFTYWFAFMYALGERPDPALAFDADQLPRTTPLPRKTREQITQMAAHLEEGQQRLSDVLAENKTLSEEIKELRSAVATAKLSLQFIVDTHDYSEAETRDYFIDLLLKEAGWPLDQGRDREFAVTGLPNDSGAGAVDYVLWGNDGRPLALVEAKRTKVSPHIGQQQAKLYADALEQQFGLRPVIFYSNGYKHWLWDDTRYPPREVQGFYKKDELELMVQRRTSRKPLGDAPVDTAIVERFYQTRAIRRIDEAFEQDHDRKALVVMATGAGKTRSVIALTELLQRCNWVKRVLFLADRVALVNQAVGAFKTHLPDASPVNLVTDKHGEGRVYVSTYPTMLNLIEEMREGERRFGVGHFDLIVIDEAHRSVYQKYRAIFEYFDALLVGLTATPKDEVDINTYQLFDLEPGVPTDAYGLEDAVKDGFLLPPRAVSVPLKFQRQGINYDDLSEDEKEQWDAIEWSEEGEAPERIEAEALNKWLFNADTVDKVLEHLMTRGQKVGGGDQLGKTIIFAKNQQHAEFIAERFDANYPHLKGQFARVIHAGIPYAQTLIDDFSSPSKLPHIAISVDMLDTGIDVPEVVNLVFLKLVRSKTKFWQMVGRGTRLRKDLFGPGQDKEFFFIFDYCQNLEFFRQNPEASEGSLTEPLGKRIFGARLEVVRQLDRRATTDTNEVSLRREIAETLREAVASMNPENVIVRPKRQLVEKYGKPEAWDALGEEALAELRDQVAGLPTGLPAEDEEAKRFDLLMLRLELAVLRSEPRAYKSLKQQVQNLASALEEKQAIPMVQQQLALILDLQTDEWWKDVNAPMLDAARKRLRSLVKLVDRKKRQPIYTDFEDEMGGEVAIDLPGFSVPIGFERFLAKARAFLRAHADHVAIHKLRMNKPLTQSDLEELECMLAESGVGEPEDLEKAKVDSHGLGLFIRSLVGLDREAAKEAFAAFLGGRTLRANQIEFVNLIVDQLTEHGVMRAERLYESPFVDIAPHGPDALFTSDEVDNLIGVLDSVRATAVAY
jgi:type I restriction enzyme, R subunit